MKTLRKMRKNAKALSPVVASIILIAVTVAVSIAVAAWMGALTIGFMGTEEVRITNVSFGESAAGLRDQATITLKNTGSQAVTITEIRVGSGNNLLGATESYVLNPNVDESVVVDSAWVPGTSYMFKATSAKGNTFVYTATGPA